jgi:hypothetical protein
VTIIVLAIIYFSAIYKASQIKIIDDGKRVLLSDEIADTWEKSLPSIIRNIDAEFNTKTKAEIDALIDEKIDAVFNPVYGQIPRFADFHYSVTGEYSEIVAALGGAIGNRVQDVLFNQVGFEANLQSGFDKVYDQSNAKIQDAMGRVKSDIQNKTGLDDNNMDLLTKTLHLSIQDVKNRFSNLTYSTIRGAGVGLGLAATGSVLAKTMGKKLAVKVAAKTAIKLTGKAAAASAGAGAGALAGSVFGPVGTVVGGIGGAIAVWLAVDKFIVEIDEHFNRKEFEQELHSMVDEQKQEIKQGLKNSYASVLAAMAGEQKKQFKSGVVTPKDLIFK